MNRNFNVIFNNVELVGGANNLFENLKITSFTLNGDNKLFSLVSTFKNCNFLIDANGELDLFSIDSIESIFENAINLEKCPLFKFDGNLNMRRSFYNCNKLLAVDVENISRLLITDYEDSFTLCDSLYNVNVYGEIDTNSITNFMNVMNGSES